MASTPDTPTFTSRYYIRFWNDTIHTTVTNSSSAVDEWILGTLEHKRRFRVSKLVVGLDTEWCLPTKTNKHQKVAILQLCVGHRCLIVQLCHIEIMPFSLYNFLNCEDLIFVGKEVRTDAKKLLQDYELSVAKVEDLAEMAALKYDDRDLKKLGLRSLAVKYLNVDMEKSKRTTLSKWDSNKLSYKQIKYAAIDAFVSFQLGIALKKEAA